MFFHDCGENIVPQPTRSNKNGSSAFQGNHLVSPVSHAGGWFVGNHPVSHAGGWLVAMIFIDGAG
jgi:hypothetical protein